MAIMVEEIPAVLLRLKPMFLWLNTELTNVVVKEAEPLRTSNDSLKTRYHPPINS